MTKKKSINLSHTKPDLKRSQPKNGKSILEQLIKELKTLTPESDKKTEEKNYE